MPKLTIDNREIEVPEGTKIIDAAERLGIMIPRFCYHPALGSVGACRVCAVKIENAGRLSGIQMSCMVDCLDGMKVSTDDPEAVDFRRYVIEWLMLNHPHDCPVCDEGGHCLLQDLTVAGGHSVRRFKGEKRSYPDQYLGPLIQHEMNRCIQCYRCSRFYQEYAGYRDLGAMGVASRVYFGRFTDGTLESPFAGNLIDICPTGVYTDKPSRYTGRRWDFERTPGICIHCSLGCHITVSARYRAIVRHEARFNESVNGHFICDRGRYGFYYANLSDRPRKGVIDNQSTAPDQAVNAALQALDRIRDQHGAQAVAAVGSARSSMETLFSLKSLCMEKGWQGPVYWPDKRHGRVVKTAVFGLKPHLAVSMQAIETSDCIVAVGTDVLAEAPMLALSMRQAARKGAFVAALDPRPLEWPFQFEHIPARPAEMELLMARLKVMLTGGQGAENHSSYLPESAERALEKAAEAILESEKPAIICGTELNSQRVIELCAETTEELYQSNKPAGIFNVLPRPNSYGAALLDEGGKSLEELIESIEAGQIKALVAVESDIWDRFYDRPRLSAALDRLELLVALDHVNSDVFQRAHIRIPTQSIYEAGGIYINQEGRLQKANPAHAGGIPVAMTGGGDHPPRIFEPDIPGGDVPAVWRVLRTWQGLLAPGSRKDLIREMGNAEPALADIQETGSRLFSGRQMPVTETASGDMETGGQTDSAYTLYMVASLFGDEPLSDLSACLQPLEKSSEIWMSEKDAHDLGFAEGVSVLVELKYESVAASVRVAAGIPSGVMTMPRVKPFFWQQLDNAASVRLTKDNIKVTGKS
ncbi:MAG: NADH-quinone oxidoreductase subunit NuoG [Desulfobacterales bacterium]